ncbi:prenylcysteine oxidase 1-like [Daktulosphaira vitifoliae]|uniref:prenylcysteine oxidase 1-like n=1 Tax=Daktulosphaira vitifoliae TaxID=58002 RepID=UPI0021AAA2C8|nr:prenylcysteine oxidase 1-like [Daktulosphaira vitifoliae]XP_050523355.1 prenylcysteine oxidase 1-like [Daktulosphaira vitifoliae]XP_050523356.1 prenylcysteine oxidase 1-like [Daktulosphaira vitifoliae]
MKLHYIVTIACLLVITSKKTHQEEINIAIIGGGIGGTSCAYFLKEMFNEQVNIDLYEGNTIGGRIATVTLNDGNMYEAGGSVIHDRNRYMSNFVDITGLEKRNTALKSERVGLYSENGFEFIESNSEVVNIMKSVWRYGYGVKTMKGTIDGILNKFDKIYELQNAGKSYDDIVDLLVAIDPDFGSYLNISIKDAFINNLGFSELLVDEIVKASLVVNYGQDVDVHQFVGLVSLAGMGGSLWAVKGGNKMVAEKLVELSKVRLIQEYVVQITQNDKKYISYTLTTSNRNSLTYDYVVFAAPLAENQKIPIVFNDMIEPFKVGKYHRTISTFVVGELRKEKFSPFSYENDGKLIIAIKKEFFNSIGNIETVNNTSSNSNYWKIFSKEPLSSYQLNELFTSVSEVKVMDWLAYPHYQVPTKPSSFHLSDQLYHINAIEWAASAMEMSCIGARNVALLIKKNFENNWNQTTMEPRVEL